MLQYTYASYLEELYDANVLEENRKKIDGIDNEVLAIYYIVCNYPILQDSISFCMFTWKVARHTLISFYSLKLVKRPLD